MRNELVLVVSHLHGQIVGHFCEPRIATANRPLVETPINSQRTTYLPMPEKLQGSDYNLLFPLSKAKNIHEIDFSEIENIMVINGIAHNLTRITALDNGSALNEKRYHVTYNMRQTIAA